MVVSAGACRATGHWFDSSLALEELLHYFFPQCFFCGVSEWSLFHDADEPNRSFFAVCLALPGVWICVVWTSFSLVAQHISMQQCTGSLPCTQFQGTRKEHVVITFCPVPAFPPQGSWDEIDLCHTTSQASSNLMLPLNLTLFKVYVP